MTTVAAENAGREFAELLRRAAAGEEIVITEHGKPIARLGPADQGDQRKYPMSLEELREWRKGNRLGPDLTIEQLIEEGRSH